jgi:hypothetical protein
MVLNSQHDTYSVQGIQAGYFSWSICRESRPRHRAEQKEELRAPMIQYLFKNNKSREMTPLTLTLNKSREMTPLTLTPQLLPLPLDSYPYPSTLTLTPQLLPLPFDSYPYPSTLTLDPYPSTLTLTLDLTLTLGPLPLPFDS